MPGRHLYFLALGILFAARSFAGQLVSTEDPTTFFTTVASRLLGAEMGVNLARIQIFPTNEYTPRLHRLLQLTANLYECTTNPPATDYPWLPRVYQPLFTNYFGTISICGYQEASGTNILYRPLRDLSIPADREAVSPHDRVRGVPLIIGVRKGLPNFNQLAGETTLHVSRRLEFRRASQNESPIVETNVMYLLSVSNRFGVECFNSYKAAFPRDLHLYARMQIRMRMTNESGMELISETNDFQSSLHIPATEWKGYLSPFLPAGLMVPISNQWITLPLSTYSLSHDRFVPVTGLFERFTGFPVPRWFVQLRISCDYALIDTTARALVDYVSLDATTEPYDVATMLMLGPNMELTCGPYRPYIPSGAQESLWCTNRTYPSPVQPTHGILNQIAVGLGGVSSPVWPAATNLPAIDFFRSQFHYGPLGGWQYQMTNVFYCPFTPFREVHLFSSWSANDPLLHYTTWDLTEAVPDWDFTGQNSRVPNLGRQNHRYEPWIPPWQEPWSITASDQTLKDSGVYSSDSWDFPQNQQPDLSWVSRVHRGTPWQTVYWKSRAVGPNAWLRWLPLIRSLGWKGYEEGISLIPTNDWRLADILAPLFNSNYPYHLDSANQSTPAGYQSLLSGMTAYTNPTNIITLSTNSSEAALLSDTLLNARSASHGGHFHSIADVIAVPSLSSESPLLYFDPYEPPGDPAYEALPSQLAARIRPDSIGCVEGSRIRFRGLSDYYYRLEESPDMVNWNHVTTVAPAKGLVEIEIPPSEGNERFFRSILLDSQ